MILHIHDMSSGFSMKNRNSVKEPWNSLRYGNFEPITATLLLSDWPLFLQERTEGVESPLIIQSLLILTLRLSA